MLETKVKRNRTLEKIMEIYNINLNIHYPAPQEVSDKLENEIGEPEDGFAFRYYE